MLTDFHRQNWSGHTAFSSARFHQPKTLSEIQEIVRHSAKVRVIGSRHCFNDIADTTGTLLWLGDMDSTAVIDRDRRTATVNAGITYENLCPQLEHAGLALPNLASLKHITVIGACATATHGSGNSLRNLSCAISKLEMVTGNGDVIELSRERDGETFRGAVVALGALGIVTRVTLDLEPTYSLQQDNYEKLPFTEVFAHFEEISTAGYSVSLFPTWKYDWVDTVWVKRRVPTLTPVPAPTRLFGAALHSSNPSGELPADRTLTPFAKPGVWHERLPHYALHRPYGLGNELQSEYFVAREHAIPAIQAILALRSVLTPVLGLSEIRTIRGDDLWLSNAFGQDTVGIHFNWLKNAEGVLQVLPVLEQALSPFQARPHLGKLFAMSGAQLKAVYPRWNDFRALLEKFDPAGKFRNAFIERYFLGNEN